MPSKWVQFGHLPVVKVAKKDEAYAEEILQIVCDYYQISASSLLSKDRFRRLVVPRHVYFYLMKKYTNMTLKNIGAYAGKKDHTTVIHGVNQVVDLMSVYRDLRYDVESLCHIVADKI